MLNVGVEYEIEGEVVENSVTLYGENRISYVLQQPDQHVFRTAQLGLGGGLTTLFEGTVTFDVHCSYQHSFCDHGNIFRHADYWRPDLLVPLGRSSDCFLLLFAE